MSWLFHNLLYLPLLNLLIFFYNTFPYKDIGVAIILLTILVRVLLFPLSQKSLKSQKSLQSLQPKMEELKKMYKDDREKQTQEMIKLYKDNKVNPLSSCLPILIQLPILIAVFQVFRAGLGSSALTGLYSFVAQPATINVMFLGWIDLSQKSLLLAVIAAIGQFVQSRMMVSKSQPKVKGSEDENTMAIMNKQMTYMMPIITLVIGMSMPGGLALYWALSTLLMLLQQIIVFKKDDNNKIKHGDKEVVMEINEIKK